LVGRQEERPACKNSDEVLALLSVCSKVQMICHCHPIISCFIKTRMIYLSGAGLLRLSLKRGFKLMLLLLKTAMGHFEIVYKALNSLSPQTTANSSQPLAAGDFDRLMLLCATFRKLVQV